MRKILKYDNIIIISGKYKNNLFFIDKILKKNYFLIKNIDNFKKKFFIHISNVILFNININKKYKIIFNKFNNKKIKIYKIKK